jgi:hypothetical protein
MSYAPPPLIKKRRKKAHMTGKIHLFGSSAVSVKNQRYRHLRWFDTPPVMIFASENHVIS